MKTIEDMNEEYFTITYWSEVEKQMVTEFSDVMLKKHYALAKEELQEKDDDWSQRALAQLTPLMKKRGLPL